MLSVAVNCALVFCLSIAGSVSAQTAASSASEASSTGGYVGYNLTLEGDGDSVIYATEDTNSDASVGGTDPDVYLNANLTVGEIDIQVDNLTAQINLDLEVLQLLSFNAGVDLSINRVSLLIQNVTARVLLEARLENVVKMVNDTLASIDLNPIIATLGDDVGSIVNTTTGALSNTVGDLTGSGSSSGSSSATAKRSFDIQHNILYSVNDYSGNTHTNRILAQNGDIVEQDLDNNGKASGQRVVGSYQKDMTYTGHEQSVVRDGETVEQKQYTYSPFHGYSVVAAIYLNGAGSVVSTQVLSEFEAGGSSTISD